MDQATIILGSHTITTTREVAILAGWTTYADGTTRSATPYAERRLAQALSEGRTGEDAVFRAIAIGEEEARLSEQRRHEREIAAQDRAAAGMQVAAAKIEARTRSYN